MRNNLICLHFHSPEKRGINRLSGLNGFFWICTEKLLM